MYHWLKYFKIACAMQCATIKVNFMNQYDVFVQQWRDRAEVYIYNKTYHIPEANIIA